MAMPRADGQGGPAGPVGPNPQGPNGQPFQGASPQGPRAGASPNPSEQMKRAGQMNPVNMGSPLPEGAQSRGSPNAINFMGAQMDPSTAPHFFKDMNGMGGNMAVAAQMNGMRPPHPGQPFNGPMNQQQMMAARQQQQAAAQGNPQMQWQQAGPNGQQMAGPPGQQGPQVQGTPQQRSMPPPAQLQAAANAAANARNTSSPQVSTAAPPTPSQGNKAAPKKKESKAAKDKVRFPFTQHVLCGSMCSNNVLNSAPRLRRSQTPTSTQVQLLLLPRQLRNRSLLHQQLPSPLSTHRASTRVRMRLQHKSFLMDNPPHRHPLLPLRCRRSRSPILTRTMRTVWAMVD